MKIGLITDAHLFHKYTQPQLYRRILQKLQSMEDIEMIVDCGDLTDNYILNSEQAKQLHDIFSSVKKPMHIVMGNHDSHGGQSLASVLELNPNIVVHNTIGQCIRRSKVDIEDTVNMLFVPYYNTKSELEHQLTEQNMFRRADVAFSHLMISEIPYSMLTFKDAPSFLHKYADVWLNGHIHKSSKNSTLYGDIYNLGSFSSVSFGDVDVPSYSIYNTKTKELRSYPVQDSLVHKTLVPDCDQTNDEILKEIKKEMSVDFLYNLRLKIPADFDFKRRNAIKTALYEQKRVNYVQFDSISQQKKPQEQEYGEGEEQAVASQKIRRHLIKEPLIDKLFKSYESSTGQALKDSIKKELKEGLGS